jgi:hypothetical protein
VIVAVAVVNVMKVVFDDVVDVIAVRNRLVSASSPVDVVGRVAAAHVPGLAPRRMGGIDREHALVDMAAVRVMEVTVVQVVDVALVLDRDVTARSAMDVVVPIVDRMRGHRVVLS